MAANNIQVFEESAAAYDAWFEQHRQAYESELRAVRAFIPSAGKGLEIGVGSGRFAAALGIDLGVEPARAMALRARDRGVQVLRSRAEALPFQARACDFVLLVTVLCFLPDPPAALQEATRVLKPQGRLIIGLIDPDSPLGKSYEAHKAGSRFFRQARFYQVGQVSGWLARLGYGSLETRQTIFQDPEGLTAPEPVLPGHGAGVFVVIAGQKS